MKSLFISIAIILTPLLYWHSAQATKENYGSISSISYYPTQQPFGVINETPLKQIKQIIGSLYALYQPGQSDLPKNFVVRAGFKVEPNGTLSSIKISKSSGSKIIDQKALEILSRISESHLFGIFVDQTSNLISFELTETDVRLMVTGLLTSQSRAKTKADMLTELVKAIRETKKDTEIGEILSLLKVVSNDKRLEIEIVLSRGRAVEMRHLWVDKEAR